jgi:hypothetical protein
VVPSWQVTVTYADLHPADDRQERPVGQLPEHRQAAGAGGPDQKLRPGGGDGGRELPAVEPAVHEQQHGRIQQRQQLAGTKPRTDHTIETALATVRDLAQFLATQRGQAELGADGRASTSCPARWSSILLC